MNFKRIKDMAYQRNIFVHSSGSLFRQVVDHLALIIYANSYLSDCTSISHWSHEIKGFCKTIALDKIKGNNSPQYRLKALNESISASDVIDITILTKSLTNKFKEEGYPLPQGFIESITPTLRTTLNSLITILSKSDLDSLDSWSESIKTLSL